MNAELRSISFKGWCRCFLQAAAIPASAALGGNLLRGSSHSHQLIQLSRLTIAFEEPAAAAQLLSAPADAIAASHDILAVQPLSERALQQVCSRPARRSLCAAVKLPQSRCIWALPRLLGPHLLRFAQLQERPLMALDSVQPLSEEVLQHRCRRCACV